MKTQEVTPIGSLKHGTYVGEFILIEDENRRRILTKDGDLLCDILATTEILPDEQAGHLIQLTFGRVCEFSIQRFGHLHSDEELAAIRSFVNHQAEITLPPLRIIDTYGWDGEVALAMCRVDSEDAVTIVDDLTASDRSIEPWGDWTAHREMLLKNLGVLWETRIGYSPNDPIAVAENIDDEFNIVFIDSAAGVERTQDLIDAWMPQLADDGMLIGTSESFLKLVGYIHHSLDATLQQQGPLFYLEKGVWQMWLEMNQETADA